MKKILIALIVLGLIAVGVTISNADSTRTINHNFRAITSNITPPTELTLLSGATIYRITGVATGSNAVFGIYDSATRVGADNSNCAIEGGEATSGDALPVYYFGEDGLTLSNGVVVVTNNCTIVIEYL